MSYLPYFELRMRLLSLFEIVTSSSAAVDNKCYYHNCAILLELYSPLFVGLEKVVPGSF